MVLYDRLNNKSMIPNTMGNCPSLRINGINETRMANHIHFFSSNSHKDSITAKLNNGSVNPPSSVSVVSCATNKMSGKSHCNQTETPSFDKMRKPSKTVQEKMRILNTTIPLNPNWANGELTRMKNGFPQ